VPLRHIVISGCSGGGKSTLIDELGLRGFCTIAEAGRIIVRRELELQGSEIPWVDPTRFANKLATLAIEQFDSTAQLSEPVFFDRCVVEPLVYCQTHGLELSHNIIKAAKRCRYDNPIFVVPPWKEIFVEDTERRHSFGEAMAEYEALIQAFLDFDYEMVVIPKMAIENRIDFILREVAL
jgi:predicted ATPase